VWEHLLTLLTKYIIKLILTAFTSAILNPQAYAYELYSAFPKAIAIKVADGSLL
jgi:hypothetical protein